MKNTILIIALAIGFQVSAHSLTTPAVSVVKPQPSSSDFEFLRAHKQGKSGLTLQWKMAGNTNVNYYEVQCTYEDPMDIYSNWMMIGKVNNFRTTINSFTDQPLYPGIITYKITAVLKNGAGTIESPIFTTVID